MCWNCQGISLLAEAFAQLVLNWLPVSRHERNRPRQWLYWSYILCRILQNWHEFQRSTVACLINFLAAFDSVDREELWEKMFAGGVLCKLFRLMKSYCWNKSACSNLPWTALSSGAKVQSMTSNLKTTLWCSKRIWSSSRRPLGGLTNMYRKFVLRSV